MTASPSHALLYHTGLVVTDLPAAARAVGDQLGVRWTPVMESTQHLMTPEGPIDLPLSIVYSMDGPHRLELVQQVPGTLWVTAPGEDVTVHHLGYWSADIRRDSAALATAGAPVVAAPIVEDGTTPVFAYHRSTLGPYIELVSTQTRPAMDRLWNA